MVIHINPPFWHLQACRWLLPKFLYYYCGRNDFHQMHSKRSLTASPHICGLSKREIEVVALLAKGHTTEEISKKLHISKHTVRTHRKNILHKAQCKNSSEIISMTFKQGYN